MASRSGQEGVDDPTLVILSESESPMVSGGLQGSSDDAEEAVIVGCDDFKDFNEDNILPQPPSVVSKICEWLRPTAYAEEGSEYRKHLASHLAGTGSWLFSSDVYRDWHSSQDHGMLWIRGIPGSGKSIFAASLIDQLKRESCPVLYFFFRQIIDANHRPVAALRDWLDQLLAFSPPLQVKLKEYVDDGRPLESLSSTDLWDHLKQAVGHVPRVYCVVDALDEMDRTSDLEPFLESLSELGQWRPDKVKVIITSRPVAHIERPLRTTKVLHIRLEEHKVDVDITTFVQYKLDHSSIPKESHDLIREAVPGRANGLFLYAKLAMDAFLKPGADVNQVLQNLPQDLNVMYADLLREHARRSGVPDDIQLLIMQSITHSSRPLRLLELAELVDVTQNPPEKRGLRAAKDLVRSACGPLLEILPDETVSVVHHSLTEFLNGSTRQPDSTSYPILEPGPTHNRLAVICLSYLLSSGLEEAMPFVKFISRETFWRDPDLDIRESGQPIPLPPPLTQYAVANWPVHVRKAALAGHNQSEVNRLLDDFLTAEVLKKWVALSPQRWNSASLTPLFVAVRLGLTSYLKVLLSRPGVDADVGGEGDGTPLTYAAMEGYADIVELLLEAGASTTRHTMRCGTPLFVAASHNRPEVIRLLTEAGADPFHRITLYEDMVERRGSRSESPIEVACQYGHLEAMQAFLPSIKTAEQANRLLRTAVSYSRAGIVELLLQHPLTEVNAKTNGSTSLFRACRNGNADIVRLLLQAGADPNILNSENGSDVLIYPGRHAGHEGNTALQALAQSFKWRNALTSDAIDCIKMLIAAGARVDLADDSGDTPLHHVQDPAVARLLLDAGADPNATNRSGHTLLHTCRNNDILRLLLEYGDYSLEQKPKHGGFTLLLSALDKHNMELAVRLLELGASGTAVDDKGNGVFHYAASRFGATGAARHPRYHGETSGPDSPTIEGFHHLVQRLQEAGADINLRNRDGHTALHVLVGGFFRSGPPCAPTFSQGVLSALVVAGADIEARDNEGRTPLFWMVQRAGRDFESASFDSMLREGAKSDTRDFQGQNLLYVCGGESVFKFLVCQGLDPRQLDYRGNTLWHKYMNGPRQSLINLADPDLPYLQALCKQGVSPTQPDNTGRTLLHLLSMFQPGDLEDKYNSWSTPGELEPALCTWLQYMIQRHFKDHGVDQADNDGVTALHLASTHSEFNTRCLLDAGADPMKATHEGLTALHIAARSRQPNILGLLLETLRTRTTPDVFSATLNAKDSNFLFERTPLNFACASGEAESVRLLLEAGASVDIGDGVRSWRKTPWHSCLEFEDEERNWPTSSAHPREDRQQPDARAVLIKDNYRGKEGKTLHSNNDPRERLDEIMDLLAASSPPDVNVLDDAISTASYRNLDYAVACLSRIRKTISPEHLERKNPYVTMCLYRRDATRKAIDDSLQDVENLVERSRRKFNMLMKLRDYDAAVDKLIEGGGLHADAHGLAMLHELAGRGFASILKKMATKEMVSQLDDWGVRQRLITDEKLGRLQRFDLLGRPELQEPVFLAACQTEVPNMDVLRVLVEDVSVDINVQSGKPDRHTYGGPKNEGALHLLARGNHWWQVAQAMPYLVQRGANTELRDASGLTPLLSALEHIGRPSFNRRAVEALIALGADVNAADAKGLTCLAKASRDTDIMRLLLDQGAVVNYATLAAAIDSQKPHVLEVLLAHGGDPNATQTPAEKEKAAAVAAQSPSAIIYPTKPGKLAADELYLVDRAATGKVHYQQTTAAREQMVQILLDRGADPTRVYPQTGTTIMHRLIADGRMVHLVLQHPSVALDLEMRDASTGCTLLLAACRARKRNTDGRQSTPEAVAATIQTLLDRGADVRARATGDGRTTLHALVGVYDHYTWGCNDLNALRRIAATAPDLVHAADALGRTPLHVAIAEGSSPTDAALILLEMGADAARPVPNSGDTVLHFLLGGEWHVDNGAPAAAAKVRPRASWRGDGQVKEETAEGEEEEEKEKTKENKKAEEKEKPVHISGQHLLERLLSAGADANARNVAGETPLFAYFHHGWANARSLYAWGRRTPTEDERWQASEAHVLALFESVGMDFGAVNAAGESLLHVVAARGRDRGDAERFCFLMDRHGLDPLREDVRHRTPLDVAASMGNSRILQLFERPGEGQKMSDADAVN